MATHKLISKTYLYTLKWLFPLVIFAGVFCYYIIKFIAYEETDEFLQYEKERLLDYYDKHHTLPEFHQVAEIIPGKFYPEPVFKDTLLLEPGDNEMVPYREIRFSINHKSEYFGITLRQLLLGPDDIAEGTLLIVLGIIFLMGLSMMIILRGAASKVWKPFYKNLSKLTAYHIKDPVPVFLSSDVEEFETMNNTLHDILTKISDDYHHQKEFNENISHELQTGMAIIRSNTEKLINSFKLDPAQLSSLKTIYSATSELIQIQKSLLLLRQINNLEYVDFQHVNLEKELQNILDQFSEVIELRNIKVDLITSPKKVYMDPGLVKILLNNLIKNAIKHNISHGFLKVLLTDEKLEIINSGLPYHGDPAVLIKRFNKGSGGNEGIGFSIIKQICDIHKFKLGYTIDNNNQHKTRIIF